MKYSISIAMPIYLKNAKMESHHVQTTIIRFP